MSSRWSPSSFFSFLLLSTTLFLLLLLLLPLPVIQATSAQQTISSSSNFAQHNDNNNYSNNNNRKNSNSYKMETNASNNNNKNSNSNSNNSKTNNNEDDGEEEKEEDQHQPLFLTPLLNSGQAEKARELSHVTGDDLPSSHSGYLTVDEVKGHHLFFWFFPSPRDTPNTPLLLWLNGGPGASSMLGLFLLNGPLEARLGEEGEEGPQFIKRNASWVGPFSMLYVDQPVGAGYSFSSSGSATYPKDQDEYTEELYTFIHQFYALFPWLHQRALYLGGQSYAGKYVPALAYKLHQDIVAGSRVLPLVGLYVGGAFFDPPTMLESFFKLPYALGILSHSDLCHMTSAVRDLYQDYLLTGLVNETFSSVAEVMFPLQIRRGINLYNFVNHMDRLRYEKVVNHIMTSPDMRRQLHVGTRTDFRSINTALLVWYFLDGFRSTKRELAVLMDNYKVLLFNGNYDAIVSAVMTEEALLSTPWSLQATYNGSTREVWREGDTLLGYYTRVGDLCRVIVHGAGHNTPYDRPDASLKMIKAFVFQGCLGPDPPSSSTSESSTPPSSSSPSSFSFSLSSSSSNSSSSNSSSSSSPSSSSPSSSSERIASSICYAVWSVVLFGYFLFT